MVGEKKSTTVILSPKKPAPADETVPTKPSAASPTPIQATAHPSQVETPEAEDPASKTKVSIPASPTPMAEASPNDPAILKRDVVKSSVIKRMPFQFYESQLVRLEEVKARYYAVHNSPIDKSEIARRGMDLILDQIEAELEKLSKKAA